MNEQEQTDSRLTRSSLMRRLTDPKDVEAWNEFVQTYARLIKFGAGRLGVREPEVDDIVQEVLLAVRQKLVDEGYARDTWKVRKWLRRVTWNKTVDSLRAQGRRRTHTGGPAGGDTPDDLADASGWITEEQWERYTDSAVLERVLERVEGEFDKQQFRAFEITSVIRETGTDGTTLLTVQAHESVEGSIARAAAETGWTPGQVSREIYKVRTRVTELFRDLIDI